MYLQALLIRAAVAVATGLMLTAAILVDHGGRTAHAAVPAAVAKSTLVTMPETVTLPTIRVHPTAAELASVTPKHDPARRVIEVALPELPSNSATISTISLRGPSIDMPYYSFGKVLPRVGSKE
jgi:hypothetical protein